MSDSGPDPERLRELGAKLDEVQRAKQREQRQQPAPTGIILRLSTELVAAPLVGTAIGFGLDWLFKTRPTLTLVFFLLGAIVGVRNVMRAAKEMNERASGRANDNGE